MSISGLVSTRSPYQIIFPSLAHLLILYLCISLQELAQGNFNGTPSYCSLFRHDGFTHSRRDDIEALGYVLLALRCGAELPWSAAQDEAWLVNNKKSCDIKKLSKDLGCPEVGEFIMIARQMSFDATPDYAGLRAILLRLQSSKAAASAIVRSSDPSFGNTG